MTWLTFVDPDFVGGAPPAGKFQCRDCRLWSLRRRRGEEAPCRWHGRYTKAREVRRLFVR
ncbi:MAG: hypothetical protein JRI59_11235 [Deltaproteobacteria bacterium]|nr:hypothetical protein [Deltaproteobacteria bacterium]